MRLEQFSKSVIADQPVRLTGDDFMFLLNLAYRAVNEAHPLDIGDRVALPVGTFTVESMTIDVGRVRVMLAPDDPARFEHVAKGGA